MVELPTFNRQVRGSSPRRGTKPTGCTVDSNRKPTVHVEVSRAPVAQRIEQLPSKQRARVRVAVGARRTRQWPCRLVRLRTPLSQSGNASSKLVGVTIRIARPGIVKHPQKGHYRRPEPDRSPDFLSDLSRGHPRQGVNHDHQTYLFHEVCYTTPSSSGQGQRPFKAPARVRIPLGSLRYAENRRQEGCS